MKKYLVKVVHNVYDDYYKDAENVYVNANNYHEALGRVCEMYPTCYRVKVEYYEKKNGGIRAVKGYKKNK